MEQAIIDIRNMYKIYNPGENEVRALDGVSLAVYKGGVCGHRRPFRQREIHADEYDRLSGHADVRYIFSQRAGRKRAFPIMRFQPSAMNRSVLFSRAST